MQFTWTGSTADWSDPAGWGEASLVPGSGDDATIDATAGPYTVSIGAAESFAIADMLLDSVDATLTLDGTLTASGTLDLQAGSLTLAGTLVGGTIVPGAATISYPYDPQTGKGSRLDNVSFAGTMAVQAGDSVYVAGTLGLAGAGGGPGLMTITCSAGPEVAFIGSAVLDNATVDFTGPYAAQPGALDFVGNTANHQTTLSDTSNTLTLGPHMLVEATNGVWGYIQNIASTIDSVEFSPGELLNAGTIATADGFIGILAASIVSTGTIIVGQHGTVGLDSYTPQDASQTYSTIEIDGLVQINGGTLQLPTNPFIPVTGTGEIQIGAASSVALYDTGLNGDAPTFDFAGPGGTLQLLETHSFHSTVTNFTPGDIIAAEGAVTGVTYTTVGGGELLLNFGTDTVAIPVTGTFDYATADYPLRQFTFDQGITTDIGIACYCAGTGIATPTGEVAVEALRPGDLVLTLQDGARIPREVHWVGWRCVDLAHRPRPAGAAPVRIRAHAFASGLPRRDLLVSPDHALLVDGVLMPAQSLLNGASIVREPAVGRVFYYHVELDRHAVLLAEGLPAESYLDTGNRGVFANGGPPARRFPDRHQRQRAS